MDLTREQLYKMLWAKGVGKTEQELGLRQTELQKICVEYDIPKPSSNYWIELKLDKSPQITPLPPHSKEGIIHTEDYIKPRRIKEIKQEPQPTPIIQEGKYPPRELPAEEPPTIFTVPDKLYAKDPIILDTKAKLRNQNSRRDNPWSQKNPYKSTPDKWLDINVYEAQEDRALRIFHTIWNAAEEKGYHLIIKKDTESYYKTCETYFVVREHHIRVQLKEISHRVKDASSYWSTLTGSGKLKFLCDKEMTSYPYGYYNNVRIAAQDTERTHIEDKIEHIIEVLGQIADQRDQAEIERKIAEERRKKEEELKRQEEERKRLEAEELARIEQRRNEERNRVRALLYETDRFRTASLIRDYATAFEVAMTGVIDSETLQAKIQWMREKADFIDPFVSRKDEWLKPIDIDRLLGPEIVRTVVESSPSWNNYGREVTKSYWQIKNSGWWNR